MKYLKLTAFLFIISIQTQAQQSLQEKYDELLEQTETYEQYKVIPRTRLNTLWSEIGDSLKTNRTKINELQSEITSLRQKINELRESTTELEMKLDQSLSQNDTIHFLGIPFSKLGYHIMVWIIIAVLTVLSIILYLMFAKSNSVTSSAKKAYQALEIEYEEHKTKSREKQAKLKRELQTAVNQLNERRS
ncbi:MAG: hypothetical protein AAFY41_02290 [Bacteroidota bacterium]